ncbi:MAG: hypothetical protein H6R14_2948 [Proteobacteria bacterium]|nr:hypothetical protein [Pseudomonadota bacterium]
MNYPAQGLRIFILFFALLGLPVWATEPPAGGLSDDDVEVDYSDGTYHASLSFLVSASPGIVIEVLTDFDHMVGVVPNLESSQIVSRKGSVFVIRQQGRANFGPFSFPFESTRQVEVFADGRIVGRALGGSTKHLLSELRVQPLGRGARVDYRIDVVPDRWMPSSIGVRFMAHEMAEQFTALIREMERRQRLARAR